MHTSHILDKVMINLVKQLFEQNEIVALIKNEFTVNCSTRGYHVTS